MNETSSFAKMDEPDRMIFIAKLHHAIWHNENTYQKVQTIIELAQNLPAAEYFLTPINQEL